MRSMAPPRHDAKMLVTPQGKDAIWGMAADKPVR